MYEAYSINSDNEFISQELKLESELSQNMFMVAAYQKYVVLITNLADGMMRSYFFYNTVTVMDVNICFNSFFL